MNASLSEDSVAETAIAKKNSDGKHDESSRFQSFLWAEDESNRLSSAGGIQFNVFSFLFSSLDWLVIC